MECRECGRKLWSTNKTGICYLCQTERLNRALNQAASGVLYDKAGNRWVNNGDRWVKNNYNPQKYTQKPSGKFPPQTK